MITHIIPRCNVISTIDNPQKPLFMRNLVYLILAAITLCAASSRSHAQAITSYTVNADSACGAMHIDINTSGAAPGQSVEVFHGDGTSAIYTLPYSGLPTTHITVLHNYAVTGTYTVKIVLHVPAAVDSVSFSQTIQYCRTLPVGAYLDANGNCTQDAGEPFIFVPLLVAVDSAGTAIDTISMTSGNYYLAYGPVGTAYTLTLLTPPGGLSLVCPSPGIMSFTVPMPGVYIPMQYFALQCGSSSGFDLSVSATFRPAIAGGGANKANIVVNNSSCTPTAAQLKFDYSPKYTFGSIFPAFSHTVTGTSVLVDVGSVGNYAPVYATIWLTPVAPLTVGDTVHTWFTVTPTAGDANPANNVVARCDSVRGSYDPNAKSVTPSGNITAGMRLEYMLQFENDGNDTAYNIHVMDTLSNHLDISTMQILSSTHAVNLLRYENAGTNILKFDFPDIRLPDSSHHDYCRGAVVFSINAKTSLSPGTTVANRVGIFFDTNPVVMTNTVYSSIPLPTGASSMQLTQVELYPNPVKDVLNLRTPAGSYSTATVYNVLGQAVTTHDVQAGNQLLDVHLLSPGIYYLTLKGAGGSRTVKFEKQ